MRYLLMCAALLAACKDSTGPARRGDPFAIIVLHAQFTDTLVQYYNYVYGIDEAGPTPPVFVTEGSIDSTRAVNGAVICAGIESDSLGARSVWLELRAASDTLRSPTFDPANIPTADSAAGYGQSSAHPYLWHWYVSNDSSVVRGDTTTYTAPGSPDPCRF